MATKETNPTAEKSHKAKQTMTTKEEKPIKLRKTKGKIENLNIIASFMTKDHGIPSDQIYLFNQAMTPVKVGGKDAVAVRIYETDSAAKAKVEIKDFISLNDHPELITYDGYYFIEPKKKWPEELHIEKRTATGPSLLERKLQDGTLTELGMEIEPTGVKNFLSGFGKFLMMGGFIIILIVVIGIVLAISILAKSC
jgi:hypothetical protein